MKRRNRDFISELGSKAYGFRNLETDDLMEIIDMAEKIDIINKILLEDEDISKTVLAEWGFTLMESRSDMEGVVTQMETMVVLLRDVIAQTEVAENKIRNVIPEFAKIDYQSYKECLNKGEKCVIDYSEMITD